MMRYSLPRKHTLRSGAAAHLGGGLPAAITSSIHGDGGRMAIERRVPDGFPARKPVRGVVLAPVLASDLGWTVPSLSQSSLGEDSRLRSARALHETSPFRLGSRSLSESWTEGAARSSVGSKSKNRAGSRRSSMLASYASDVGPRRSRARSATGSLALLSPTRREIATGSAVAVPAPVFDVDALKVAVETVELADEDLPVGARSDSLPGMRAAHAAGEADASSATPIYDEAAERAAVAEAEETIRALRKQQTRYEREKRYMEADAARTRAEVVAAAEEQRRRDALITRQLAQRAAAAEAFEKEREALTKRWVFKIEHFDTQVSRRNARRGGSLRGPLQRARCRARAWARAVGACAHRRAAALRSCPDRRAPLPFARLPRPNWLLGPGAHY